MIPAFCKALLCFDPNLSPRARVADKDYSACHYKGTNPVWLPTRGMLVRSLVGGLRVIFDVVDVEWDEARNMYLIFVAVTAGGKARKQLEEALKKDPSWINPSAGDLAESKSLSA